MTDRQVSCHLGAWPSLAAGLAGASSLGFAGYEAFGFAARACGDQLGTMLGEAGLRLSALSGRGTLTGLDGEARRAMVADHVELARLAASVGCDRVIIGPGPWRGWARPDMRPVAAVVQELARAVADVGVVACLQPHRGSEVASAAELRAVLDRDASGFVAVCPDTAHLAVAGDDPAEVVRDMAERVAAVRIKDVTADGRYCVLGQGVVDAAAVFDALDDIGYRGWATVEVKDTDAPTNDVRACRDHLAAIGRWPAVRA